MKMTEHLKILLLEDSEDDASLIQHQLHHSGMKFTSLVVDTRGDFIEGIKKFDPDIILSDHSMPEFSSADALKIFKDHLKIKKQSAPFIVVTGGVSENFAVQCIKDGADDYILKDHLQRLPAAIENAMEKCRIQTQNHQTTSENLLLLERYEYVTKATSVAVWDWDIVNNSVYCSKGFQNIFGHTVAPQKENNNLNTVYICVDDIERVLTGMQNAINSTCNNWQDEYKYLKANGDYAFVLDAAVIIRNEAGKAIRMIGALKDITVKKTESLRSNLIESVIKNTSDAILLAQIDSSNINSLSIVYVNDAFTTITGYQSNEVLGKSPRILQGEKTDQLVVDCLQNALEKNTPCQVEMLSYKKNGEELWLDFAVAPIADANGVFTHWVFIERDITRHKNNINAIEQQNIQLKDIAWMQSHVVRAPLARMMGFIRLIKDNRNAGNEIAELLPYILDAAQELDAIIRKIVARSEKINNIY